MWTTLEAFVDNPGLIHKVFQNTAEQPPIGNPCGTGFCRIREKPPVENVSLHVRNRLFDFLFLFAGACTAQNADFVCFKIKY
jgi:hypothetical protein